jgi:hypothetical protein
VNAARSDPAHALCPGGRPHRVATGAGQGRAQEGEEEEEESDGGRPPERWNPQPPSPRATEAAEDQVLAVGACRRVVSREGRACCRGTSERRRGVGERSDGGDRRRGGAPRTLEEEEAGLLQFEVSGPVPDTPNFERLELSLVFFHPQGSTDRPRPCAH